MIKKDSNEKDHLHIKNIKIYKGSKNINTKAKKIIKIRSTVQEIKIIGIIIQSNSKKYPFKTLKKISCNKNLSIK